MSKGKRRTKDQYLPNGSVICWSRRQGKYVPVRCGVCGSERMLVSTFDWRGFTGLCQKCAYVAKRKYTKTGTETLPTGSIIYWAEEQQVNGRRKDDNRPENLELLTGPPHHPGYYSVRE